MATAPEKTKYQRWYEANKEELSKRRKALYQNDPEHRAEVKKRQREYRKNHPPESRAGASRFKEINGIQVEVFRIGDACKMIGREEQTIRGWEEKGVIPRPSVEGVHRNYTKNQIVLMRELAQLIDQLRYDKDALQDAITSKSQEIHQLWEN